MRICGVQCTNYMLPASFELKTFKWNEKYILFKGRLKNMFDICVRYENDTCGAEEINQI